MDLTGHVEKSERPKEGETPTTAPEAETAVAPDVMAVGRASTLPSETSEETANADQEEEDDLSLLEGDAPAAEGAAPEDLAKNPRANQEVEEEGFLEIYKMDCLNCKTLVPSMPKSFKSCHYTTGNLNCPGRLVKIIQKIPLDQIVPRFVAAQKAGNYEALAKLSAKLAKRPEWFQQRVRDAIKQAS
jgi:hypothetical protein